MITGGIDELNGGTLSGWAFNADAPDEHLEIAVMQGSLEIVSGTADVLRRDLPQAGIGSGDHAFRFGIPSGTLLTDLRIVARSARHGQTELRPFPGSRAESVFLAVDEFGDIVGGVTDRLATLETRMEAAEVFFVRIDEMLRKLVDEKSKQRKRFLGIF